MVRVDARLPTTEVVDMLVIKDVSNLRHVDVAMCCPFLLAVGHAPIPVVAHLVHDAAITFLMGLLDEVKH